MTEQRRWLTWAILAYAGILLVTSVGLGLLYRGARQHLDEALGLRLQAAASAAVHLVEGNAIAAWSYDPQPNTDLLWLTSRLERIRDENDLAEITLCDRDGFMIASAARRLERGEPNIYWDLDRAAVELAREGLLSVSRLYRSGDLYQKSAHAPVFDRDGVVTGVLTVEGNADFFDALAAQRRAALAAMAGVVVFLGCMGFVLWRIHRALERARASLARQERLAAMGRMTAGIAHEIRNPLGIIRGSAQHLQRILADHGIQDPVAAFIPEEVDRLDRILTGYLSFGTDRSGEPERVDLEALVHHTLALVRDELATTGVSVDVTQTAHDPAVDGDPRRLQQLLLNLLLNAQDAMPSGGRIQIRILDDNSQLRLSVADEGSGLDNAGETQAFEPFWTSKDKGSGLGLAVSRRIAEEHGGTLEIRNRTDRAGCVAALSLPRAPANNEE